MKTVIIALIIILSVAFAYADIVILVPKILPQVKYADKENPTQKEIDAMELYQERVDNYALIKDWLEKNVTLNGKYKELIDWKKAPTWLKGDDEYMLFVLKGRQMPNSKANPAAILGGLNSLHAKKEFDFTATDNVEEWLKNNGYTRREIE